MSSSVLDRIPARVVLLIGWLGFLVCAFPGVMTWDSFGQLGEARSGVYSDGHPPVMALVWSVLDRIVPGPFGMLVLQSWSFLLGSYFILLRAMRPLLVRWRLRPGDEYAAARERYSPFSHIVDPDEHTRGSIARLVARAVRHAVPALVLINNKAEGCAPESAFRLASAIAEVMS